MKPGGEMDPGIQGAKLYGDMGKSLNNLQGDDIGAK